MKEVLLRHDGPVPRYTSYPTAPHFHSAVGAETYAGWLRGLVRDQPLSLYLHVPFCRRLCWFCGCHTAIANGDASVREYGRALKSEILLLSGVLGDGFPVARMHVGGGSPTILPADLFSDLVADLRDRFDVRSDAEIAVEVDPRALDGERVDALARSGVTRASLGVQDVDPAVQQAINRIQPIELTARRVEDLRRSGIRNINLDIMYGLPYQSVRCVERTADAVAELRPQRVALFGYAHVPWMKKHQALISESALPAASERFDSSAAAAERLQRHGYIGIGIDHFALPDDSLAIAAKSGRLHRNFQGYTDDPCEALIGLGASAIGSLPQGYIQNLADTRRYMSTVLGGQLAVCRGVALGEEDRLRRAIIERLMCDFRVDLGRMLENSVVSSAKFDPVIRSLDRLRQDGLVIIEGDGPTVAIPPEARSAARLVCAAFDEYLAGGAGRHSASV